MSEWIDLVPRAMARPTGTDRQQVAIKSDNLVTDKPGDWNDHRVRESNALVDSCSVVAGYVLVTVQIKESWISHSPAKGSVPVWTE